MALSITVHGQGTFTASMEEGPVTFTAAIASVGPQGATGATGATGVVAATAPITYNSGTQTVGIDDFPTFTGVVFGAAGQGTIDQNGITFPSDSSVQTTAFIGEARKEYIVARNSTGTTIGAGKVVYLSGATGNKPTVALALADSETTSARTIGVTAEAIANNADGKVIISGAVENIDTSAFTAGDTLYLSATTAGGLQTTLPAAPLHGVVIGIVTRANPSVGSIEVAIQNYQELSELSDVNVSDKANNDGLFWEASSSTWRSKTIAEVLGYTPSSLALTSFSASAPISYNSGTGAFTFDSSGFLLKADNLSGLASASTARTNLGLGTMATETASNYLTTSSASSTYLTQSNAASNYAPLASPTFTGDPKAPTPATSDNDTSIATTAFVNAYCPAASTTTAGKVELADASEARAATSTDRAVTPSSFGWLAVRPGFRSLSQINATAVSGSGAVTANSGHNFGREMALTSLATGRASFRMGQSGSATGGPLLTRSSINRINFSNKIWMAGTSCMSYQIGGVDYRGDSETICRIMLSGASEINTLSASFKGFGITKVGGVSSFVNLTVHDGTNLTNVATTYANAENENFEWVIYSDGTGNVTLWINGSQAATTSNGPTGLGNLNNGNYFEQVYSAGTPTVRQAMLNAGGWLYIES